MFVMSQDRLFLQEMTGKRLGAYGKYLFIEGGERYKNESGRVRLRGRL